MLRRWRSTSPASARPCPGFLSARPAGTPLQVTSFLNTNGSGQAVAATTIRRSRRRASRSTRTAAGTSWSTSSAGSPGASADDSSDGLFVPLAPQRLLDTRETQPRAWPGGTVELPASFPGAAALVTNVTATRADRAGFVTAYPAGTPRPDTSTLNPAMFEHTVANMAITQLSDRGLAYYSHAGSDVIVDVTGMFTGSPVAATLPPPPNSPAFSRVLLVGDSTLAAVSLLYPQSQSAFIGFEGIVDAASCRRLLPPVVQERGHPPRPQHRGRGDPRHARPDRRARRQDRVQRLEQQLPRPSSTPSCGPAAPRARTRSSGSATPRTSTPRSHARRTRRTTPTSTNSSRCRSTATSCSPTGGRTPPASTTGRGTAATSPRRARGCRPTSCRAGSPPSSTARARSPGDPAVRTSTRAHRPSRSARCPTRHALY